MFKVLEIMKMEKNIIYMYKMKNTFGTQNKGLKLKFINVISVIIIIIIIQLLS